jgi:DNA-binding transcriptional MerR regulator/GGDEF domain-containing protein
VAPFKPNLLELLGQADVVQQLREAFVTIQASLTTTISEASDLTKLSESQLRYAEKQGLLSPNRALLDDNGEAQRAGQRRYSADDLLRARLIGFLIDYGISLSDIGEFMAHNSMVIQDILDTKSLRLRPVLDGADEVAFRRFFIPRVLYYSLMLLFERDAIDDAGIVFPIRATRAELDAFDPAPINTVDDLGRLGHVFVAWRARGRPLATFVTVGNPFDDQKLQVRAFDDVVSASAAATPRCLSPQHAYLIYGAEAQAELEQAERLLGLRQERAHVSDPSRRTANPRVVAGRLMRYVQWLNCSPSVVASRSESALSDVLFFNSPEMVNPTLGDALLNRLANAIVELGGSMREFGDDTRTSNQRSVDPCDERRWRFSCILMPREPADTFKRQELVVRAQSREAPHRVGVTTTSPQANGGLTFRAYSSGRIAYRPSVTRLDPAVSYVAEEEPIGSAIAAPAVDGNGLERSQPPAIIYVASREEGKFQDDDFLLIRVIGRLVGEIVQTYSSRSHLPSALTDTLTDPEMVDGYFAGFLSELSFVTDLERVFQRLADKPADKPERDRPDPQEAPEPRKKEDRFYQNVRSVSLFGVDIDDYSAIQRVQGDLVARQLTREIGKRLGQRLNSGLVNGVQTARLYRIWADRFYLLVRDEDAPTSIARAEQIRKDIAREYLVQLERDAASDKRPPVPVHVRMVGATFGQDELKALWQGSERNATICAAQLSRILEDGLKRASGELNSEDRSVWWDANHNTFLQTAALAARAANHPAGPLAEVRDTATA